MAVELPLIVEALLAPETWVTHSSKLAGSRVVLLLDFRRELRVWQIRIEGVDDGLHLLDLDLGLLLLEIIQSYLNLELAFGGCLRVVLAEDLLGFGVGTVFGEQQLLLLGLGEAQHGLLWRLTFLHFGVEGLDVELLSDELLEGGVAGVVALLRDLLVLGELVGGCGGLMGRIWEFTSFSSDWWHGVTDA